MWTNKTFLYLHSLTCQRSQRGFNDLARIKSQANQLLVLCQGHWLCSPVPPWHDISSAARNLCMHQDHSLQFLEEASLPPQSCPWLWKQLYLFWASFPRPHGQPSQGLLTPPAPPVASLLPGTAMLPATGTRTREMPERASLIWEHKDTMQSDMLILTKMPNAGR